MNNPEKLATQGTQYEEKQRNWQHRVHNTKTNRETGSIGYTIRRKTEKLATQGTQYEEKQNKNTAQYVLDTTMGKQTHKNVTNGSNDLTNILFMWKSSWTSQQGGQT